MSENSAVTAAFRRQPSAQGLYDPANEHDACGVGFIANQFGEASYAILDGAITGLRNLAHRGAIDADAVTGDGAGVLTQLPFDILLDFLREQGKPVPAPADLAAGMFFLPRGQPAALRRCQQTIERAIKQEGLTFLAFRSVPVDNTCLGRKAEATRPEIVQALLCRPDGMDDADFDRRLLLTQKTCTRELQSIEDFYVVSLSARTIVYKGLLNAPQVRSFFLDLKSPKFRTAFAVFHQRFATNTFPDWAKSQPFRMMAHNGEINTIRGNRNNMRAREYSDDHGVWGDRFRDLVPMVQPGMSDSASFDNCLQLMAVAGRPLANCVSLMMPVAWEHNRSLPDPLRAFYKYHSVMMEPWDGPAAVVFCDGRKVGASLDRNGLRPLRYKVYEDGTVIVASETGLIPHRGKVLRSGRLGPGKMVMLDLERQSFLDDAEIKHAMAASGDYAAWCRRCVQTLDAPTLPSASALPELEADTIQALRVAWGYDLDEEKLVIRPMLETGKEPITSMGDDTPLAVLSRRPRLLYTYFKQLFSQVTNPAIDSLRERAVMSLKGTLGGRLSLFDDLVRDHHFVALESPVLLPGEYQQLLALPVLQGKILQLDATWPVDSGVAGLEAALSALRAAVRTALEAGPLRLVVISDEATGRARAGIPMLLAAGAVHSELVQLGRRIQCDVVCATGEARDVHQIACLLGFGANAVYPWFLVQMARHSLATPPAADAPATTLNLAKALDNYRKSLDAGILKIMSKMGISTLFSYLGAKTFEALGIEQRVIDECFAGTACPMGGIGYPAIAEETLRRHALAWPSAGSAELWNEGYIGVNKRGTGEYHAWSPKVVSGMNSFLRKDGDFAAFGAYREASDIHQPVSVKDLLRLRFRRGAAVPLDEVESIEDIRQRFTTAGMSLGAISPEMHETLAIAMNRIGGKSNSGEGGEDPRRYRLLDNGDNANSAIKQVASGRFGVTAEYLANAREIEIKIAQGAKPGEGGQLMGWKVSALIARLRHSVAGVTLISPPPHHDIYSIEDLAQLIFDLKEVNPRAKVCVKLVSCSGVGTVAAGVAKAYADVILISGHDGGTGASPISSIKHAGSPWETGLAEAHQVLMLNNLRNRVTLRTDGGMKTGRDIVLAALLGAEEYNFGTAALIAGGCAMFRVCHLNTCPVGVATQREDLRAKFRGKPEYIIAYFNAVAQDVRLLMSRLGCRSVDEMVGRTDLLEALDDPRNSKTRSLDFSKLLYAVDPTWEQPRIHTRARNDRFGNEGSIDDTILQEAKATIVNRAPVFRKTCKITNICRNIGTRVSGEIAYLHGNQGMPPATIQLTFKGSAGQSFGCFLVQGMRLSLIGESNDYVGKGMNGGEIIIRPDDAESFAWHENVIIGNTCLYGATGGHLFAAGTAGERFAVRNSGATAVVEGVGEHACEYMTGGTVVVLGSVGSNFGAGMSGGLAFVYDPANRLAPMINPEMVYIESLADDAEAGALKKLLETHHRVTNSPHAGTLLADWPATRAAFKRVAPHMAPELDKPVFAFAPLVEG
jgi:glutamate synthase (ferredoxin)